MFLYLFGDIGGNPICYVCLFGSFLVSCNDPNIGFGDRCLIVSGIAVSGSDTSPA